ncbi:MAG TPA: hypothetical protein VGT24_12565 [Candidatus Acidoferrales bacterium]|nr:hypothetical protein [Candidatus Acidoferrales bacterium]
MRAQRIGSVARNASTKGPEPWFDLTANGGLGDGSTDNTTAINNILSSLKTNGGGWLFAPQGAGNTWKTGNWTIPSAAHWSRLDFWGTISPTATLVINHPYWWLNGVGGSAEGDFQRLPAAQLAHNNLNPTLDVNIGSGGGTYVSGISIGPCIHDCFRVEGNTPNTTWDSIWATESGTGTGAPFHIVNSFGHYFRDVGFSTLSASPSAVAFDLTGPAGSGSTRMVYCDTCFFRGGTVKIGPTSTETGFIDQFFFLHPFWEGLTRGNSYFTINTSKASGRLGNVTIISPEFADAMGTNYMFCITGPNFSSLTVIQPSPVGNALFCPSSAAPTQGTAIFLNPGRDCASDNITAGLTCLGNVGSFGAQLWSTEPVHGASYGAHVTSVSAAAYSLKAQDGLILCAGSPNSPAITLPVPSGAATIGLIWTFFKTDTGGTCAIIPGSGNIEGLTSVSLSNQYDFMTITPDGTNYKILSSNLYSTKTIKASTLMISAYSQHLEVTFSALSACSLSGNAGKLQAVSDSDLPPEN